MKELADIQEITVNRQLDKEERIADFLSQIKNPYLFRYGNIIIQCEFSDTEYTLADRIKQYLTFSEKQNEINPYQGELPK